MKSAIFLLAFITCGMHVLPMALAQSPKTNGTQNIPDFAREVLPILSNKCFVCHGPDAQKNIKLTTFEEATTDHKGSKPINPDDIAKSEILIRLHDDSDPMPPLDAEKQLTTKERKILTQWVQSGGKYAKHWAYVAPVKSTQHRSIDDFISVSLKPHGISLADEANKAILARRVSLILTGLPPEPEVLATYLADDGAGAYESLVDTLLDSPRYGEHQARYWLDAVRYGDTHGLHLDNKRGIYPYRDWVIQALNGNLPFNDFITWQIAGDLLPNPSLEQQVATGYVRLNPSTSEGGAIPAEFQAKNNFDRVETLGTAFLGMSMLCVRCHTHKYDPVPHEEYYRLMAFFNSTAESAMDGNSYDYKPNVLAPRDIADWENWRRLNKALTENSKPTEPKPELIITPLKFISNTTSEKIPPKENGDKSKESENKGYSHQLESALFKGKLEGLQLEFFPEDRSENSKIELDQFKVLLTHSNRKNKALTFRRATILSAKRGVSVEKISGESSEGSWSISIESDKAKKIHLELMHEELVADDDVLTIQYRTRDSELQQDRYNVSAIDNLLDRGPKGALERLVDTFTTTLVAQEGKPRETFVLERGEYNLPIGDSLTPDVISVVGPMPEGAPKNRLGLAQWLTSRDNPLVARVLVNRFWQQTFGEGLVRTPEEFGLQGEHPTHPELLDWLAVTFQETGWDTKSMLKQMVMSKTFKQSSRIREDVSDPANRLFARGPSFRLDAEVLRDLNLWASGILDPHMGGEGVKPYQPDGMWKALAHPGSNTKQYVQDDGEKLYRRSLYVYWKRTSPHPMMTLFDAPNRETSCVRRSRSNTPLQSLALFNETQRVETARILAERLLKEENNDKKRFDYLFNLIASRNPTSIEYEISNGLLKKMHTRYEASAEDVEKLLAIGNMPRDESLEIVKLAAWTQVTSMLLASDLALLLY